METTPPGEDKAPYLAALVASSWITSAIGVATLSAEVTPGSEDYDPDLGDPDLPMELATRLADYITALEPLRAG